MKIFKRFTASFLPLLLVATLLAGNAQAALQAVGPTDPVTSIPTFYQDTTGRALVPCLDQNGFCILAPPFLPPVPPGTPITTLGPISNANFPFEAFYYYAIAILPIEAGELAKLNFVLEYAFLTGVVPNTGVTFLRTDLQKMINLTPNSTYRVTHPYGVFQFTTDATGKTAAGAGVAIRQEDPIGTTANFMPPLMKSAAFTNIGPFLTPATGILPTATVNGALHTYIGDALTPIAVTGSPTGNNFFKIERLNALGVPVGVGATWQTNNFVLAGRVFTGQIPSPLTIDRTTYARDAVGTAQVDVFATALPTAFLNIVGTPGLALSGLAQDVPNTGKFFAHLPVVALPTVVSITNSLDIPPIPYPVTLVDEVIISQANYNPVTRNLTIKAVSRDNLLPLPALTVPAFAAPNTLDATGTVVLPLPLNTIPPMTVQVVSSHGGSATAPVSVVIPVPNTITSVAGLNGTISPLGATTVTSGATQIYTITANAGFMVTALVVDGVTLPVAASYTFINVTANHTISANFGPLPVITATTGLNGNVSPLGATTVAAGANQIYTITPIAGFKVATLVVDGVTLPGATSFTFTNVTVNHTISATFGPFLTISAAAGPKGTISPAGATSVLSGANQTFTFAPVAGYMVTALMVDGVLVPGAASSYTFINVTANHYINAYFAPSTITISSGAGGPLGSGSIFPLGVKTITGGSNQTYTITPASPSFVVAGLIVDGVTLPGATSYTFTNVTTNHYINAYFRVGP